MKNKTLKKKDKKKMIFIITLILIGLVGFLLFLRSEGIVFYPIKVEIEEQIIKSMTINENSHSFTDPPRYTGSFNVSFENGLKIVGNDSKGQYSVKITGFIERTDGVRQNFALNKDNIPFKKLLDGSYKYNITISSIPVNIKYVGLYLTPSLPLDIEINNHDESLKKMEKLSFCGEDSCIDFWFNDIPLTYIANKSEIKIDVQGFSNLHIDPTIGFSNSDYVDVVDAVALTNTSFAITWCDETTDDIHLKYYYTNGTNYTGTIDVHTAIGTCGGTQVAIALVDSSNLVVGYFNDVGDNVHASVYDFNGNLIMDGIIDSASVTGTASVDVAPYNSNSFVIIWQNATTAVNNKQYCLTNIASLDVIPENCNNAIWNVGTYGHSLQNSVTTFNSTLFGFGLINTSAGSITYSTWNNAGSQVGSLITLDSTASGSSGHAQDIASLNSTHAIIVFFDDVDDDVTYAEYDSSGNQIIAPTDIDTAVTTTSNSVSVTALNSTHFVMSYLNGTHQRYALYNNVGTQLYNGSSSNATQGSGMKSQVVISYNQYLNIGFCNQNWIHVWENSTTTSYFTTYQFNGSSWDGTCPAPPSADCWSYNSGTGEYYIPSNCQCYCTQEAILNLSNCNCETV